MLRLGIGTRSKRFTLRNRLGVTPPGWKVTCSGGGGVIVGAACLEAEFSNNSAIKWAAEVGELRFSGKTRAWERGRANSIVPSQNS